MKKIASISVLLILIAHLSQGQSLQYSLYQVMPTYLNPAKTGEMNSNWRASVLYRQQWRQVSSLFESTSISVEYSFKDVLLNKNNLGVGLLLINDTQGNDIINELHTAISIAYHHHFGPNNRNTISIGAMALATQTTIDYTNFQFGDQYVFYQFNNEITTSEPQVVDSWMNFNMNAGVSFSHNYSSKLSFSGGVGINKIVQPQESAFASPTTSQPGFTVHASSIYKLRKRLLLLPQLKSNIFDKTHNTVLETQLGFKVKPSIMLLGGAAYRYGDGTILLGGFQWQNLKLVGAYDLTMSDLNNISDTDDANNSNVRAFEVGIIWKAWNHKSAQNQVSIPCKLF